MDGKQLVEYGISVLVIYFICSILAPLINWIIYLIPTAAVIMIVVGIIKMVFKR